MPGKIKKVAEKVAARQSERHGRTVSTATARAKAKGIIKRRKPKITRTAKRVQSRSGGSTSSAKNRAEKIIGARQSAPGNHKPKGPSKVARGAKRVRDRRKSRGLPKESKAASRTRAKIIIAKRKAK